MYKSEFEKEEVIDYTNRPIKDIKLHRYIE